MNQKEFENKLIEMLLDGENEILSLLGNFCNQNLTILLIISRLHKTRQTI